jgi:hypothetical protein
MHQKEEEELMNGQNTEVTTTLLFLCLLQRSGSFRQRFQVNDTFYKPGGPVFLMLGGEGPANGMWLSEPTAVMLLVLPSIHFKTASNLPLCVSVSLPKKGKLKRKWKRKGKAVSGSFLISLL